MIPLRRLYTQPVASGLAEDERFPKPGPSHNDELLRRVSTAEEQAKLTAHLQLSRDRRMGLGVPSLTDMTRAQMLGPLAGISSSQRVRGQTIDTSVPFWNRKYGFKGNNGSTVHLRGSAQKPEQPPAGPSAAMPSAGPTSSNLRR